MDTKTLVVGQDIYMESGVYGNKGKVVKVTPEGVDVQATDGLLHFDPNGRSYGNGTYECGPWELVQWYYVLYRVSGDVTGSRSALLKRDGMPQKFNTLEEAENIAKELNESMNSSITSTRFSYQAVSQLELDQCKCCNDAYFQSPQIQILLLEIYNLVCSLPAFPVPMFCPDFEFIKMPNGHRVCAFSLRDVGPPEGKGDLIEITDEKLLEKLRSIKGQYVYGGHPVFYYEHLMSTADYKVHVKTW